MARSFDSTDAKRLIDTHRRIQEKLNSVLDLPGKFVNEIKSAADKLVATEVLEVLRGVPIEELNRGKRGLKTKALRDYGYRTIADIATASVYQIASVYGVSEDSAYTIHRIVKGLVDQAKKDTRIRISADDRSPAVTDLVVALSSLRRIRGTADECGKPLDNYKDSITYAMEDLIPGTSGLKWLFSSKSTKEKSEKAYAVSLDF